ncbi:hypothetical protein [Natroniella sp. ANB-PHB2]|uniref:gp53-like domain-containing protein n=1 Tax=Natroniella sp. ANB-PHB2 TaxID=3384444 RepID=UPI0038D4C699
MSEDPKIVDKLPKWLGEIVEPPESKKETGWLAGEGLPFSWLNWLFNKIYLAIKVLDQDYGEHKESDSGVHGVGSSNVASEDYADSQADVAESSANQYTDSHEQKDSGVHGVGESEIESTEGSQQKVNSHSDDTSGVHGVGGSNVASEDWVSNNFNNYSFSEDYKDLTNRNHGNEDHNETFATEGYVDGLSASDVGALSDGGDVGNGNYEFEGLGLSGALRDEDFGDIIFSGRGKTLRFGSYTALRQEHSSANLILGQNIVPNPDQSSEFYFLRDHPSIGYSFIDIGQDGLTVFGEYIQTTKGQLLSNPKELFNVDKNGRINHGGRTLGSSSGYADQTNRLRLAWGESSGTIEGNETQTVSFEEAFPNACLQVILSGLVDGNNYDPIVTEKANGYFVWKNKGTNYDQKVSYIAIGY